MFIFIIMSSVKVHNRFHTSLNVLHTCDICVFGKKRKINEQKPEGKGKIIVVFKRGKNTVYIKITM